jgi:hypothetical protein
MRSLPLAPALSPFTCGVAGPTSPCLYRPERRGPGCGRRTAQSRDRVGVMAPWGDRQSELFYDIYSTHADLMRRAYLATHSYVYMI